MNTKHTPGPWAFETCPVNGHIVTGALPGECSPEVVARVMGSANARLIAAAPDLLAALHLLMSDPSRKALLPDTVLAARAAIAKATNA